MSSKTIYGVNPTIGEGNRYHYVYRITNVIDGIHYYGSRTCDINPYEDLGTKYFSSRPALELLIKESPEEFKFKIIGFYEYRLAAEAVESSLHYWFDAKNHPKFYNKRNHDLNGFNPYGMTSCKDKDGEIHWVSVDDPRIGTELFSIAKGMVTVRDSNGKTFRVSVDDPMYISGEVLPTCGETNRGMTVAKDNNNNVFRVPVGDNRLKTGELVGINKGMVSVKDSDGKTFSISVDDPGYTSGELKQVNKGMVTVRDSNGKTFRVSVDDPRIGTELFGVVKGMVPVRDSNGKTFQVSVESPGYISGELKHVSKGKFFINDGTKTKAIPEGEPIPEGWVKGSLNTKGKVWINDGTKTKAIPEGEPIPEGWVKGSLNTKGKIVINDGKQNKRIDKTEPIPEGWVKGSLDKIGKVLVKDRYGKNYSVPKDDPKFLSGEYVGIQKKVPEGYKWGA